MVSGTVGLAALGLLVIIPILDMCLTGRRNRTDDQVFWDIIRNIIYLSVGGILLAIFFLITATLYYILSCFGETGASLFGLTGYWFCPFGRLVGPSANPQANIPAPKEQCCCCTFSIHCSLWGILSLPLFFMHMIYALITNIICCRSSLAHCFSSFEQIVNHPFQRQVQLLGNPAPGGAGPAPGAPGYVPPQQFGGPAYGTAPPQYGTQP